MDTTAPDAHRAGAVRVVPVSNLDTDDLDRIGHNVQTWRQGDVAAKFPPDGGTPPDSMLGRPAMAEDAYFLREMDPGQQFELTGSHGQIAVPVATPDGQQEVWATPQPVVHRSEPEAWDAGIYRGEHSGPVETPISRDAYGRTIIRAGAL